MVVIKRKLRKVLFNASSCLVLHAFVFAYFKVHFALSWRSKFLSFSKYADYCKLFLVFHSSLFSPFRYFAFAHLFSYNNLENKGKCDFMW